MIIEFTPGLFDSENFKPFNLLFQICTNDNRYEIVVDYINVNEKPFFERLDIDDQDFIKRNFTSQILRQASDTPANDIINVNYSISESNPTEDQYILNIKEATAFFNQKVMVILENSLNDSYFIKGLITQFDMEGTLKDHVKKQWISFENAGGCTNVQNLIIGKLNEYAELPKEDHTYLRAFVILDSDRENPTQPINYKHKNLLRQLRHWGVAFHVLEKRMMENYMPDEVIGEYGDNGYSEWANAYLSLSPRQKDFLNINKGFSKKNGDSTPKKLRAELFPDTIALYHGVSDENYMILDQGFKLADFKTIFPKGFINNPLVDQQSLRSRTNHQSDPEEVEIILQKIRELL